MKPLAVLLSGLTVLAGATMLGDVVQAASWTETANHRCVTSDGLPNHSTGQFPTSGNPHRITRQTIRYCMPLNPVKGSTPQDQRGSIGVAINGVTIRPGTADWWDSSSRRGHSRDRSSGWNLEGLGAAEMLGMDMNNAHVDERGLYHYHGVAAAVTSGRSSLFGIAADGFEIHLAGPAQRSSWQLKPGTRPSGPGGRYDGTYVQDWEYVAGSGTLDQCNGGQLEGRFVYFATQTYPFFPRCLWGQASADFATGGGQGQSQSREQGNQQQRRRGPPVEALQACVSRPVNTSCRFTPPGRSGAITGICRTTPSGQRACAPAGYGGRPPPGGRPLRN